MSTISISISDEDLSFLRSFSSQHGLSVEDFMIQQARNLRLNLQPVLHPDIVAASGTFQTKSDPQAELLPIPGAQTPVIVMLDIHVLLDVFIMRQPHYLASAQILSRVADQKLTGIVAARGLTTLYYLARKQADRLTAENSG